ncbi:tyrosine-type recombinase/integrase [Nonomuraea sp. NBC_00507]|uniref:tyrosine-type recombinase/integrase n=1 Tax=Nonomuraea sp. NBC_00507 TaxID=2976002 RepID=UPI002E1868F6
MDLKSRAGVRTVAIPEAIVPALRDHLDQFTGPEADALIFTGSRGGILRRSNFRRAAKWDESTEKIGFPGLHFHDLRHTGNMIAASSGASFKDLMQRMGHDSVRAALIYQHSTADADRRIADAMNTKIAHNANESSEGLSLAPAYGTLMARSPVSMIGDGAVVAGGRYWVRTSDPSLVSVAIPALELAFWLFRPTSSVRACAGPCCGEPPLMSLSLSLGPSKPRGLSGLGAKGTGVGVPPYDLGLSSITSDKAPKIRSCRLARLVFCMQRQWERINLKILTG